MILLKKIAKWYLYLLSAVYILVGVLALISMIAERVSNRPKLISQIFEVPIIVTGLFGPYIIVMPLPILYGPTFSNGPATAFTLLILAGIAIVFGVLGIRAAKNYAMEKNHFSILLILTAMSIIITLYNLTFMGKCYGDLLRFCIEPAFAMTGVIQSLLIAVAIVILKKNTASTPIPV